MAQKHPSKICYIYFSFHPKKSTVAKKVQYNFTVSRFYMVIILGMVLVRGGDRIIIGIYLG